MRSRSLRHLVTFMEITGVEDDYGDMTDQWKEVGPEWVQIIPLKGEEKFMSQHLNTIVDHKIRMRFSTGIDAKMKIVYGDREFQIDSILNPFERNRELNLMVSEDFRG